MVILVEGRARSQAAIGGNLRRASRVRPVRMPAARVHDRRPGTSPPGRIFLSVLGAVGLLTCAAISAPGGYFLVALVTALAWCALGTIWGVWLLVAVLQRAGREGLRRRWRQWLSVPAIALLVFANVALDAPLRMRLALSEPALRAAAVAVASGESMRPGWYGLFELTTMERFPGGARFQVRSTGFLEVGGFAYSPGAPPPVLGSDRYEHLTGPWYSWIECWD